MRLVVEQDYDWMSRKTADLIVQTVREKPDALLCLAAGSTPVGTFRYLVEDARNGIVDLSECFFAGLDEWVGLQPTAEGSCRKLLQDELFTPLSISESQIRFFDARTDNLAAECERVNRFIEQQGGLDLVLIGVGMNGHLGFNEPGVPFDWYAHVVELDEITKEVGQKYFSSQVLLDKGVTLGIRHIMEASTAILIANGNHKAEIVNQTWTSEVTTRIPSTVLRNHPNSWLITDREAASLIERSEDMEGDMSASPMKAYAAGIDVGGTKTLLCIAERSGRIVASVKSPTVGLSSPDVFFQQLYGKLEALLADYQIKPDELAGVGIGIPGIYSEDTGIIASAPALNWPVVDIRPYVRQWFDMPVFIDNDVNLAAMGERWQGAAKDIKHMLLITVGTGVGSAMILNGELYKGAHGAAGEMGYFIMEAAHAGASGSQDGTAFGQFEAIASGSGIGEAARTFFNETAADSLVMELAGNRRESIDAKHVMAAAEQEDRAALHILELPLRYMSVAVANAVSLLNPEVVVLGGGVACGSPYYIREITERVAALTPIRTRIRVSSLGNEAGAVGGAAVVFQRELN